MHGGKARGLAAGLTLALAWPMPARAQPTDDRATAEALLKQLEQDAAHRAVLADSIRQTKDALERATRMRAASDEAHARAAEGLAREWAETGRDLARAAAAEASAAELRQKALDAQAGLERQRALVEEGIARIGRLTTELSRATGPEKPHVAVEVHEGDSRKEPATKPGNKGGRGPDRERPAKDSAANGGTP